MPKRSDFPNAKWLDKPHGLEGGGSLVGMLPNGDQVQLHKGVYVRIATKAENWNPKYFEQAMREVRRARQSKYTDRAHKDLTARIVGDAE